MHVACATARPSSGGVALSYVLPVLLMTSCTADNQPGKLRRRKLWHYAHTRQRGNTGQGGGV